MIVETPSSASYTYKGDSNSDFLKETMSNQFQVVKRSGQKEQLNYDKIHKVLYWATEGLKNVSISDIEINAKLRIHDDITTGEIHTVLIQSCSDLISEKNTDYQYVASKLLNYFIRKNIYGEAKKLPHLKDFIKKNIDSGIYEKEFIEKYSEEEVDLINDFIKHDRDFNFTYAGIKQFVDKYALKNRITNELYETPQYVYAIIPMVLYSDYAEDKRIKYIREYYNCVSQFKINLPTPIMCGVRAKTKQYSSCVLLDCDDNLNSILSTNSAIGYYTANRAGIGLNLRIRAVGSPIKNGEVVHTGIVPFLKMFEATTKSLVQNGVRGGSATVHFPFWHLEIEDLIVLKNNKGTEDNRVRKLDYSIQLCRLFYKRVKENGMITLFSPHDVQDLYEAFGYDNDKFDALYEKYENTPTIKKKQIKALDLFQSICKERIETGRIYIMNLDNCNSHSSFKDKIYMSNLCQEITLPTKPLQHIDDEEAEIALCVLGAINMGEVSLDEMEKVCEVLIRSLDCVVEKQSYPVKAAIHMKKRRSLGIGIINLAYFLAKHKLKYDSEGALPLVDEYMEYFSFYCLKASAKLAKEQGKCEWFDKTKYSDGKLPLDTYNKNVDKIVKRALSLDWEGLRKEIQTHGLRNSTFGAIMPCESSSLISNSTNGIEPPRSLISIKQSKKGKIKQCVPEVSRLKNQYTTAFEMKDNTGYLNICAIIQKYIDQAISTNCYYNPLLHEDGNIPISIVMKEIFYHYSMGGKTMYYLNTYDGKTDESDEESCAGGACSI